jgi:hypothetical protein
MVVIKPGGSPGINPSSSPQPPPWGGDGGCGPFFYLALLGLIVWGVWSGIDYFFGGSAPKQ